MKLVVLFVLSVFAAGRFQAPPTKRALLIGIDDYTASTLRGSRTMEHRGWPDLQGTANDVDILREMLVDVYGFHAEDIVTLTNQQATRAAILQSLERHLVQPAAKDDILFFYFAGHGSQVPNPFSDEPDRLDESIVPADSRIGARDIRDKELRPLFNRVLDRGAHLTLLLDHCHSGSGFRGGRGVRGIGRARPIADAEPYGPRPEQRGALVLASAQDLETAWEVRGDDGRMHGAFTWAWIRAMRDAAPGEPAQETFLRAQARLRAERADQTPAMLGPAAARLRPFLGAHVHRNNDRVLVAVEKVDRDGNVVLQGGWVHGLSKGAELRVAGDSVSRLRITTILGLGRSVARIESGPAVRSGILLELRTPTREWWNALETPRETPGPYRLALLHEHTQELVGSRTVTGGETYSVVLRATRASAEPRYYYVFVIDSHGNRHLVFPRSGSVENRFPIGDALVDVRLGAPSAFEITPPYGLDTYVLLSTDEPLPNPAVLTWDGVRVPHAMNRWSIERVAFESVAPRGATGRRSFGRRRYTLAPEVLDPIEARAGDSKRDVVVAARRHADTEAANADARRDAEASR